MAIGYGGTKESNLTNETTMETGEFVRIVTSGSRKITLADLLASSVDELESLGFITDANFRQRVITNTSAVSYPLTTANEILLCDATANDVEVIMPLPALAYNESLARSYTFTIKKVDASASNVIEITPTGAAEIDGEESIQLIGIDKPYIDVITDGVNWWSV